MAEFNVPDNVRSNLEAYERTVTQNLHQHNQMNVIQYEGPGTQEEFMGLNQNERYNADGDDTYMRTYKGDVYDEGGYKTQGGATWTRFLPLMTCRATTLTLMTPKGCTGRPATTLWIRTTTNRNAPRPTETSTTP